MRPDERFRAETKSFWACVRTLSQQIGYTVRGQGKLLVPSARQMTKAFDTLNLNSRFLFENGRLTDRGERLQQYFNYRADVLHKEAEPNLMDAEGARKIFSEIRQRTNPSCPLPMNKQKGDKKNYAFLTGIVNMIVEEHKQSLQCDYDPRELTTVTRNGQPLRTLSRRVDGAFPSPVNPVAIWEIKEYYYTTTFGSRIADGVYETLLDGLELEELKDHEGVDVEHYLMVDAYNTWWRDGKSYLCRMVDMTNMGYVDEVLFGQQVVTELPRIVEQWVTKIKENNRFAAEPQKDSLF